MFSASVGNIGYAKLVMVLGLNIIFMSCLGALRPEVSCFFNLNDLVEGFWGFGLTWRSLVRGWPW